MIQQRVASPFVPIFRELVELRYLRNAPICMDNARLKRALGTGPQTPLNVAVRETLIGLGCIPRAAAQVRGAVMPVTLQGS